MKKLLPFAALTLISSLVFASSTVNFPFKHQEIKVYPGNFEFVLNHATGLRNDVYYTMICQIVNPTNDEVIVKLDYKPYRACKGGSACGTLTVNGEPTSDMIDLAPGTNEIKQTELMTASYNPVTSMSFTNYDNDDAVFIENCQADLQ